MNSKQVLDKILTLLSIDKKGEVQLTYAKLADGTIVESPTFDVGESLDIVTEDGKTPAPDGEHELSLRDSSGNENLIKVKTEGGKIVERANIELPSEEDMEAETKDVKDIPEIGAVIGKEKKEEKMAEEEELPSGDGVEEEVDPLPEDEVDMKKKYEDMTYRIEELEKRIAKMEEAQPSEEEKEEADVMEDKTPKLDGAPIDDVKMNAVFSKQSKKSGVENAQNSFLAKLYK
jgi:hypothetical protein